MTDATSLTPYLSGATTAELEDWGPLEEATGAPMSTARMTVTPDGGAATEIAAGDVAVFPRGWSGTWDIHETVRKVYAIF
jgi:uncharacterized protein